MSSNAVSEATTPNYETLLCDAPPAVPQMNTTVTTSMQNVPHSAPPYYVSPPIQVWNASSVVPQWCLAAVMPQNTDSSSPFYTTFLKGKPRALGIILIVAAILEIALGIGLCFTSFSITRPSGISFWGPVFYIIAGSLTIAARSKPNICLVKGSLSLNIISSIFCFVALILNSIDIAITNCYNDSYYHNDDDYYYYRICLQQLAGTYTVLCFLLVINLLLFCVSISAAIFGCRSLSHVQTNVPQVFVIQNDVVISMNPSTGLATSPGFVQQAQPPPYTVLEVKTKPIS